MTKPPLKNKIDLIIIGGGASGLAAACIAAKRGKRLLLLESRDRIGKKILATGNGRCNLSNAGEPLFFGATEFALEVLQHCSQDKVLQFFHELGLTTVQDVDLIYPATLQAATVLDTLLSCLQKYPQAEIITGAEVIRLTHTEQGFSLRCADSRIFSSPAVIAAVGGPAQPRLSGSDSLTPTLQSLGHRLIPRRPALTGLLGDRQAIRGLKGLRIPAICTLCGSKKRPVAATEGELLFTDDGVSGVCAMQLSRDAGELLNHGESATLYLDLSPLLGLVPRRQQRVEAAAPGTHREAILQWLRERAVNLPSDQLLTGALPRLLRAKFENLSLEQLADSLSAYPIKLTGIRGWDHAQVAAGGIDCRDVDAATLQSRLVKGLYLTGEVLDVDGDCGGHNLLFAWASGILAAKNI